MLQCNSLDMRLPFLLRKATLSLILSLFIALLIITQLHHNTQWPFHSIEYENLSILRGTKCLQHHQLTGQSKTLEAIQNSTWGFQKVLVLGLPDRLDKKDVWSLANIASGLSIEWVDGIRGEDINPQARPAGWKPLPDGNPGSRMTYNTVGSLRGHMNAIRRIVDERLSSALILEDDVEWDIMIRQQLTQFANGARYIHEIEDSSLTHSPYGDEWDLFLLGHCTAGSPLDGEGRYWVAHDDPTVPPKMRYHWRTKEPRYGPDTSPPELQGNFSRIIFEPESSRCTYAYALSFRGAQKLLYHFSVEPRTAFFDSVLSDFCADDDIAASCVAVFPNLFDEYLPAGSSTKDSDRRDYNMTRFKDKIFWREHGTSNNIVFPVKAGLRTHINSGQVYESQWPDESLWPQIDPLVDQLPMGKGYFLTRDKFTGIEQSPWGDGDEQSEDNDHDESVEDNNGEGEDGEDENVEADDYEEEQEHNVG